MNEKIWGSWREFGLERRNDRGNVQGVGGIDLEGGSWREIRNEAERD